MIFEKQASAVKKKEEKEKKKPPQKLVGNRRFDFGSCFLFMSGINEDNP